MEIPPLFKADNATLNFHASKDGKITVTYQGWDDKKVVWPDEVFEIRCGKQGGGPDRGAGSKKRAA